jgi:hypothetical protein
MARRIHLLWFGMDREPRIRAWLALSVFTLLIGLLVGAGLSASHKQNSAPAPPVALPPPPAPEPETAKPASPPVLKRADLLAAAARAAADYSAGQPYSGEQKTLAGRRFELVTPFGCEGPTPTLSLDPAQVAVDAKAKTLVFSAQPRDWSQTGWVKEIVGQGEAEAIEGFWIPRPWQTGEGCPLVRPPAAGEPPPTLAPPSVGVVQLLGDEDSRLASRADRPFRVVRKASDEELQSREVAAKFVLSGRLSAFPGGEVVRCRSSSVDQWPVCLISVQLDRVAFLSPADEILAEWSLPAPAQARAPADKG